MSDTDIYKSRQRVPVSATQPRRRRRSRSKGTFDESGERRRRSKNTGLRRLLHLTRKPENEKKVWLGALIVAVAILAFIAIWQFGYMKHVARKQSRQNEMHVPSQIEEPRPGSAAE